MTASNDFYKARLTTVIKEAERFIAKAKEARASVGDIEYGGEGTKLSGAARRASMDLTRALADFRGRLKG